jgi:hypothetical protein
MNREEWNVIGEYDTGGGMDGGEVFSRSHGSSARSDVSWKSLREPA